MIGLIILDFIVGIVLIVMGYLIWVKKKINLMHDYHVKGIQDTDGYCKWMGKCLLYLGVLFCVVSVMLIIGCIDVLITQGVIGICIVIDIVVLVIGQKKFARHIM